MEGVDTGFPVDLAMSHTYGRYNLCQFRRILAILDLLDESRARLGP